MTIFCIRLKSLREENGFSLQQLANMCGVSAAAIQRWEKGLRVPNIDNLRQLALSLKVSADYLIGLAD